MLSLIYFVNVLMFYIFKFIFLHFVWKKRVLQLFSSPGTNVLGEVLSYPRRRRRCRRRCRRCLRQFQVKVFVY